jgi:hypothetical protein
MRILGDQPVKGDAKISEHGYGRFTDNAGIDPDILPFTEGLSYII